MKLNKATEEMALRVAATLISDNTVVQEDWVNKYKDKDLVSGLSDEEDNYIAVMCFAPVYIMKDNITRLSLRRDCIRDIKVMKDIKPIFNHLFAFVGSAYVIFKKQPDGDFVELPYQYGYERADGVINDFHGGLILPLPQKSKFWVDIDNERIWIDPPKSAFESNCLDINRNCWMDCTYFESVMGGGEINEDEMCDDCPIRLIAKDSKSSPFQLGISNVSVKTEWIETEQLLGIFAPSILRLRNNYIYKERYSGFGPSLTEQLKFVESLKKTIKCDDSILSFKGLGEIVGDKKIEAYNFFLLRYIAVSDNTTGFTIDLDIKIYGFNTYSDLNKFIIENLDYTEGLLLFIKDEGTYREALCSLILKGLEEIASVSWDEFALAKETDYLRKLDIPQLCEIFEVEGSIEEAQEFYAQEVTLINSEIIEKEIHFDYTVGLCNSKSEVESLIYCRNLNDEANLIEGIAKYGYIVLNNNVFEPTLFMYFIICKDGVDSFEIKRI